MKSPLRVTVTGAAGNIGYALLFRIANGDLSAADHPLAAWAGVWRPTDEWGDAYTGVMVDATKELWDIHDRMPVILPPDAHDIWLRADAEEAMKLVTQYPADKLVVERTDDAWFARKAKPAEDATLI